MSKNYHEVMLTIERRVSHTVIAESQDEAIEIAMREERSYGDADSELRYAEVVASWSTGSPEEEES